MTTTGVFIVATLRASMEKHFPISRPCHSRACCIPVLVVLGFIGLSSIPCPAEDLQTAYQQAVATSPVIAQARAALDAELAGKPLARAALLPHINAFASGGMNTAYVTGFGPQPISTGYIRMCSVPA